VIHDSARDVALVISHLQRIEIPLRFKHGPRLGRGGWLRISGLGSVIHDRARAVGFVLLIIDLRQPILEQRCQHPTNRIHGLFGNLAFSLILRICEGRTDYLDIPIPLSCDFDRKCLIPARADLLEARAILAVSFCRVVPPCPEREEKTSACQSLSSRRASGRAYFDLHLLLKAKKAGQTKFGIASWYSFGKLRQCLFVNQCFCLVDLPLIFTDSQHPIYSSSRAFRTSCGSPSCGGAREDP
jgi:hypothetical protein